MKRLFSMTAVLALVVGISLTWAQAGRQPRTAGDLLQFLPDGTGAIVVDVQRVTSGSLWAALSSRAPIKSTVDEVQGKISSELGLSLSDVYSVALVLSSSQLDNFTGAVSGNFDQDRLLTKLRANPKIKIESEKYKGFDVHKVTNAATAGATQTKKQDGAFTFMDAGVVVFGTATGVRSAIDTKVDRKPSAAQNAKLGEMLSENPGAAIRFAIEVPAAALGAVAGSGMPLPDLSSIKMVFGSVDMASNLDINATLRHDSAPHAQAIADQLKSLVAMVKGFAGTSTDPKVSALVGALDSVKIEVSAANNLDVKVSGSLTQDLIGSIIK